MMADRPMLLAGWGGITTATAIGFALPLLTARSLPLTGRMTERPGRPPRPTRRAGLCYLSLEREKSRFRRGKELPILILAGLMAFSAGAMLMVVFSEMIVKSEDGREGAAAAMLGYVLMMALDLALA